MDQLIPSLATLVEAVRDGFHPQVGRFPKSSRSQQRCNTLYSMRGVRLRAHQLTGVLSLIRWDVE